MIGIYKIENKINGKIYVGQSKDIERRWYEHRSQLNHNRHDNSYLQSSWNKYGEKEFHFSVLEECSINELNEKEMLWINVLYSNIPMYGYNLTAGGAGLNGFRWSDEGKEYLSAIRTKDKIVQLDLNGSFIKSWRSASHAARSLNIPVSGIRQCVLKNGDQYQCHGFIWLLAEVYDDNNFDINTYINTYLSDKRKINQYDLYGNIVRVWDNTEEINREYSASDYKGVFRTLNHSVKSINNYIYLYVDDKLELTDDYLLQCRIDAAVFQIKQSSKDGKTIKIWNREDLMCSDFKYDQARICCTKNRYHNNGKLCVFQGYVWEYV